MTISVHTTSAHVFRQIRNLDHFGTYTTSVHVSRIRHRYISLRYIALTTSVQCYIGTLKHVIFFLLNHALLRDTVGPGKWPTFHEDMVKIVVNFFTHGVQSKTTYAQFSCKQSAALEFLYRKRQ